MRERGRRKDEERGGGETGTRGSEIGTERSTRTGKGKRRGKRKEDDKMERKKDWKVEKRGERHFLPFFGILSREKLQRIFREI